MLDNARHTRRSAPRTADVPAPVLTWDAPRQDSNQRGSVLLRLFADPERATHEVAFERSVAGGDWEAIGTDSSSPAYSITDDLAGLAPGTAVAYRATLSEPDGTTVTSAVRTIEVAPPPLAKAVVHYLRPAGDYTGWGLHLWGDAVDPAVLAGIAWDNPLDPVAVEDGWARYEIAPEGRHEAGQLHPAPPERRHACRRRREPGGDRSFVPIDSPEIWLVQGDPVVYTSQPPTG